MSPTPPEIIDLTESSPAKAKGATTPIVVSDREDGQPSGEAKDKSLRRRGGRSKARRRAKRAAADMEDRELASDSPAPDAKRREVQDERNGANGAPARTSAEEHRGTSSRRRTRSRTPERASSPLVTDIFFEDLKPTPIPLEAPPPQASATSAAIELKTKVAATDPPALLLPAHVEVLPTANGSALPVEVLPAVEPDSDEDEYIEYLDYDDRKAPGTVRYFLEEPEPTKPTRIVCKKCGAENDHKTFECTVMICLTCGARDEHPTRSCPISKTCFNCGMKGHISQACPSGRTGRYGRVDDYYDCDRCGSRRHRTLECPTLWRIYEYVASDEKTAILVAREGKSQLGIGNGGEGYIATDEWCYMCGESGHFGDDCRVQNPEPEEPSAFGSYNTMSGPFTDVEHRQTSHRGPRDWEAVDQLADGWGANVPTNVGQQGRNKDRTRMEQRARAAAKDDDDEEDWFGSSRNARARGMGAPSAPGPSTNRNGTGSGGGGKGKISFGSFAKPPANANLPPRPSEGQLEIRGAAKRLSGDSFGDPFNARDGGRGGRRDEQNRDRDRDRGRDRDYGHDRDYGRSRDYDRDRRRERDRDHRREKSHGREYRDRDRDEPPRRREENRPRYNGGYPRK